MGDSNTPEYLKRVVVRSYESADHPQVMRLYSDGLLFGDLDPNDTAADLEYMEDAYFGQPQDHFWVAMLDEMLVGMVGVVDDERSVGQLRRLRAAPEYQHMELVTKLIQTALEHCREHGYLKVILDTHVDPARVVECIEGHGYQYTRKRNVHGRDILEFYLNLYQKPIE